MFIGSGVFRMVKLFSWIVVWECLFVTRISAITDDDDVDDDVMNNIDLSTTEVIKKYGYPLEIYSNVTTEDGYLLDIFRIPHGKNVINNNATRGSILLMHGIIRTSRDWVVLGPKKGLGFLLADRGYDIWLPNSRGTVYSRKHVTLNPDTDKVYWNFSWHEIGYYDLATTFELMRNVTKKERIAFIGISQGTTEFYVLTSLRPDYNRNVSIAISLAPIAYLGHSSKLIRIGGIFEPIAITLAEALGIWEVIPRPLAKLSMASIKLFCFKEGYMQDVCINSTFLGVGFDPTLNKSIIAVVAGLSEGSSLHEWMHYAQIAKSDYFRQFDLGKEGNLEKYGSEVPPSYDLSKITAPMALFYSNSDEIATPLDVKRLCKEVSNCAYLYEVPAKYFNHFDFLIAQDVYKLIFRKIFYLLRKYNTEDIINEKL